MKKESKSRNIFSILPVILLTLVVTLMAAARFPSELEAIAEDELYQQAGVIPDNIKIIAIDETTLGKLGPYSEWDRSYFAELIERLNSVPDAKPLVIGMDVIFSGTNSSQSDMRLAKAAEEAGNVVLASKLEADSRVVRSGGSYAVETFIGDEITAYEELSRVCQSGFTNIILDDDGYVRRVYTRTEYEGKACKSFAYLIAEKVRGEAALSDLPGTAEIRYTGNPGEFETIPMSMVLSGEIPAGYFKDCVVLVGAHEEGMLDSYKVPIDRSTEMYGVECHANAIHAFIEGRLIKSAPLWAELLLTAAFAALFAVIMRKSSLLTGILSMAGIVLGYPLCAFAFFSLTSVRLSVLYIPVGAAVEFLVYLLLRYVELQKKRADDMQKMLFSMADCMAEAIEGRTPYNANHTKNVARRCIEMLDYINLKYREKKTGLHFSEKDRNQLYLAAMLHDIGKMDVPLEVMDKPTKLGHREEPLRSRLEIISLRLQNDALTGAKPEEEAQEQIDRIQAFLDKLGLYNCGKRLEAEEWAAIDRMCASVYRSPDGKETPFITKEEADDLHINAGTLSQDERQIMQSHVVYTDKILQHMHFGRDFSNVRAMAANHHELLNAKGYPNGIGADKLDVMTRMLTIMDIYDSLIADDRPYKKAKPIKVAFDIL
ncbi:MAG: CHASE2 domain-containing protein, partial [Ruminiclostridium sp.]